MLEHVSYRTACSLLPNLLHWAVAVNLSCILESSRVSLTPESNSQEFCCSLLGYGLGDKIFQSSPGDYYAHPTETHILGVTKTNYFFLGPLVTLC